MWISRTLRRARVVDRDTCGCHVHPHMFRTVTCHGRYSPSSATTLFVPYFRWCNHRQGQRRALRAPRSPPGQTLGPRTLARSLEDRDGHLQRPYCPRGMRGQSSVWNSVPVFSLPGAQRHQSSPVPVSPTFGPALSSPTSQTRYSLIQARCTFLISTSMSSSCGSASP